MNAEGNLSGNSSSEDGSEIYEGGNSSTKDEMEISEGSPGRFVRRIKSSSESELESDSSEDGDNRESMGMQELKERYNSLLEKFKKERQKKQHVEKQGRRCEKNGNFGKSSKLLADRIRGWQILELEKLDDHKQQYHAWLVFKSIVEANWEIYEIHDDREKLICLQTKGKGFVIELINSIQRNKPSCFADIWNGLHTRFYAPIDSAAETSSFYQMKQSSEENIFNFFERVSKQAYLCDFAADDYTKRIGETFARNCLNPAYFLGIFDKFDDLDKLKNHAKNFHAALPQTQSKNEPVLAVNYHRLPREFPGSTKRRTDNQYDDPSKRRRAEPGNYRNSQNCKFCGRVNCNRRYCPARGKNCNYCEGVDHFEIVCYKKKFDSANKLGGVRAVAKQEKEEKVIPNNC